MLEPAILLTIGLAIVAGIVWAVRIEGRVNMHDRLFEEREKQVEDRHQELQARLIRIEAKLDRYDLRDERSLGDYSRDTRERNKRREE